MNRKNHSRALFFTAAILIAQPSGAVQITANTVFGPPGDTYASFGGATDTGPGEARSNIVEQDGGMQASITGNDAGQFNGYSYAQSWIGDTGHTDFSSIANFTWEDTFTNASSVSQDYFYTLNIDKGFLGTINEFSPIDTATSVYAKYNIDILLDGVSIWSSDTQVNLDSGGVSQSQTGTSFGGAFGNFNIQLTDIDGDPILPAFIDGQLAYGYQWDAFSDTINLGAISPGQAFTLSYQATVETGGTSGSLFDPSSGGYITVASLGDPTTLTSLPGNSVSTVPVPGAAWLFLSGLGVIAGMRRRNQGLRAL